MNHQPKFDGVADDTEDRIERLFGYLHPSYVPIAGGRRVYLGATLSMRQAEDWLAEAERDDDGTPEYGDRLRRLVTHGPDKKEK